jgi:hypothetical protein
MQFSKKIVSSFTWLEMFSHSLERMKVNYNIPWPTQSPHLNIIEPLWSVLETRVRDRFPPPTTLKQLGDVLQEDGYKIVLDTVQNLYESIPRRIVAVLKAKMVQCHIHKEMCTVSLLLSLFCPATVAG